MEPTEERLPHFYLNEMINYRVKIRSCISSRVGSPWNIDLIMGLNNDLKDVCKDTSYARYRSLLSWMDPGGFLTSEEVTRISIFFAAHKNDLKEGRLMRRPSKLPVPEWAATQFRRVLGINEKGVGYEFLIFSGSLAGIRFSRSFSSGYLYHMSLDLGFSRFIEEKRWDNTAESLVRMMLAVKLKPTNNLANISFSEYRVPGSLLKYNKETLRYRIKCPYDKYIRCTECSEGFDDCFGSCREEAPLGVDKPIHVPIGD